MSDRTGLPALPPVGVLDVLAPERATLCDLLRELAPDDWERPTECTAWTVRGFALHVLGEYCTGSSDCVRRICSSAASKLPTAARRVV